MTNTSLYLVVSVLVFSCSVSLPKMTVLEEYIEKMESLSVEWLWKMNGGKWQEPGDTQQVTDKILTFCFLPLHACSSSLQSCSLPYCAGLLDGGAHRMPLNQKSLPNGVESKSFHPPSSQNILFFCSEVVIWKMSFLFFHSYVRNIWVIKKKCGNVNVFNILNARLPYFESLTQVCKAIFAVLQFRPCQVMVEISIQPLVALQWLSCSKRMEKSDS